MRFSAKTGVKSSLQRPLRSERKEARTADIKRLRKLLRASVLPGVTFSQSFPFLCAVFRQIVQLRRRSVFQSKKGVNFPSKNRFRFLEYFILSNPFTLKHKKGVQRTCLKVLLNTISSFVDLVLFKFQILKIATAADPLLCLGRWGELPVFACVEFIKTILPTLQVLFSFILCGLSKLREKSILG